MQASWWSEDAINFFREKACRYFQLLVIGSNIFRSKIDSLILIYMTIMNQNIISEFRLVEKINKYIA